MDTKNKTYKHNIKDCENYQQVDLNKVSGKLIQNMGSSSSFYFYKNDNGCLSQFIKDKLISKGAYGAVYLLNDTQDKNIKIALKEFRKIIDPEFDVLKKLEEHDVSCNIMKARLLELRDEENKLESKIVTVNELFNGTLSDLYSLEEDALNSSIPISDRTHLQISTKMDMFQQLVEDLYCLAKKGFYYTDLKADNVLYKCVGNGKFRVAFGDLGSLCHKEIKSNPTFTYYPPEGLEDLNLCSETSIVWGLGILLLELVFFGNYDNEGYELLDNLYWMSYKFPLEKYDKLMEELDRLSKGVIIGESLQFKFSKGRETTVLDLIKMLLTIDYTKRITLEDIRKLFQKSRFKVTQVVEKLPTSVVKPTQTGKSRFNVREVDEKYPESIKPTQTGKSRFNVREVDEKYPESIKPTQTGKSKSKKSSKRTLKKKKSTTSSKHKNSSKKTKKSGKVKVTIV